MFSLGRKGQTDIITVNRLDSIVPLSSFHLPFTLRDSSLATSPLFQRDQSDLQSGPLDENTLRKHLRYLSPETAISKRISDTSDIYSFGVLAYEMLTGTTIDGGPDSPEETAVDVLIDFHRHITMKILPPREWLEREAALGGMHPAFPPKELSDIVMRCLTKDPELRYASFDSLAYDLTKLSKICKTHGQLSKFMVGEVDDLARFQLPDRIVARESQLDTLDNSLQKVLDEGRGNNKNAHPTRVVNLSGADGSGKTRIVRQFIQDVESSPDRQNISTAWAKVEESLHPPLSSFSQIFTALLERFLADPNEDVKEWNEKIRNAAGNRFQLFVSLVPADYWRMLGVAPESKASGSIDWGTLKGTFTVCVASFTPLRCLADSLQVGLDRYFNFSRQRNTP